MCEIEIFTMACSHEFTKLLSYCHFARNDPLHQCFGPKTVKNRWAQRAICGSCAEARDKAARARLAAQQGQQ